jgi:hypothetical protein
MHCDTTTTIEKNMKQEFLKYHYNLEPHNSVTWKPFNQ